MHRPQQVVRAQRKLTHANAQCIVHRVGKRRRYRPLGCLTGALLFRWFWTVLLRGLRETILIRQKAAALAATPDSQP